ncbi:MAG: zinc-ribbon and DUF3426 domain-containing protein [Steroidobacteraceae bacterium]
MFTVCPKCALTLVVTAADLRVAQGYVRCGRCSSVFNALAQLSDAAAAAAAPQAPEPPQEPEEPEEPAPPPPPPAPAGPGARAAAPSAAARVADEDPIPEDALEFNPAITDASSVFVTPPPDPEWTAATGSFKALVAANQEPTEEPERPASSEAIDVELDAALLSDIMDSGTRAALAATPAPRETAAAPAPAAAAVPPQPRRPSHTRPPAGAGIEPARSARPVPAMAPPDADEVAESDAPQAPAETFATRAALPWMIGAGLMVLALLLQIIDHQRDALATDARIGRPLTALYSMLGVRLTPRWDLRAYDVRQLGAIVEPGSVGAITVRASIRNVGVKAQPLPLLRVTLQDRFGNRLASREVPPRDYLPRSVEPPSLMSVDQRIDAQLAFVDPGASAVGFELDACLPARGGGVACANDASAR